MSTAAALTPNAARPRPRPRLVPPPAELPTLDPHVGRLANDARTTLAERAELAAMAGKASLSRAESARVEAIAQELPKRLPGHVHGSLLAGLPRPLRPPSGTSILPMPSRYK